MELNTSQQPDCKIELRFGQFTIEEVEWLRRTATVFFEMNAEKHEVLSDRTRRNGATYTEQSEINSAKAQSEAWEAIYDMCTRVLCGGREQ